MSGYAFISYARVDKAYVDKLSNHLLQQGVQAWYEHDLTDADQFTNALAQKISRCAAFVVVLTPESVASARVEQEVTFALGQGKAVLPLELRPVGTNPLFNGLRRESVQDRKPPGPGVVGHLRTLTMAADRPGASGGRLSAEQRFAERVSLGRSGQPDRSDALTGVSEQALRRAELARRIQANSFADRLFFVRSLLVVMLLVGPFLGLLAGDVVGNILPDTPAGAALLTYWLIIESVVLLLWGSWASVKLMRLRRLRHELNALK